MFGRPYRIVDYLLLAGFGMREKHCFRLEIYDRLRVNEEAFMQAEQEVAGTDGLCS